MSAAAFFSGISMAAFAASAIFFLKFWKASHDRFFLFFSICCGLLSLERIVILITDDARAPTVTDISETTAWVYLIRLAAFICLTVAIVTKNRRPPPSAS